MTVTVEDELREVFRLTPREARVAMLLAARRTNREIAAALGVSEHTARRHTEKVLLKLDVHRRYDVRGALLQCRRSRIGDDEAPSVGTLVPGTCF